MLLKRGRCPLLSMAVPPVLCVEKLEKFEKFPWAPGSRFRRFVEIFPILYTFCVILRWEKNSIWWADFETLCATSVGIELHRSRYLRNLEETSLAATTAPKKSVDREKSPFYKSRPFFFRAAKISTFRDPERNSCRIYLKPGSFDPHYQQYFYTHLKRYLKVRGSRVIWDFLFNPQIKGYWTKSQ